MTQLLPIRLGGHRGGGQTDHPDLSKDEIAGKYSENSLLSIEQAIKQGADFIEIDVVLSQDGVPMVTHSNDLRQHVFAQVLAVNKYFVSQYTAEELQKIQIGPAGLYKTIIPTLEEVMALITRHDRVSLNIELKGVQGTEDNIVRNPGLVQAVKRVIESSSLPEERLLLSSFARTYLHEAKQVMPGIRRGMLFTDFAHTGQQYSMFPKDRANFSRYEEFTLKRVKELHKELELSAIHPEIASFLEGKNISKEVEKHTEDILEGLVGDTTLQSPQGKNLEVNVWFLQEEKSEETDRAIASAIKRVSGCGLSLGVISNHIPRIRRMVERCLHIN